MGSSQDAESIDVEVTAEDGDRDREWILWWVRSGHCSYTMITESDQPQGTVDPCKRRCY